MFKTAKSNIREHFFYSRPMESGLHVLDFIVFNTQKCFLTQKMQLLLFVIFFLQKNVTATIC